MKKVSRIKLEKIRTINWKIVSLWGIVLVILLLCMKAVINRNAMYISVNYAPYGTSQNYAKLEYGKGIFKHTIREKIEDFSVTFKVNANHVEDAVIRIGDQSGTVQIESIEIQSDDQYILLLNEEILDFFTFNQIDQCEVKDEWIEIFTYDIEQSEFFLSSELVSGIIDDKAEHIWVKILSFAILGGVMIYVLQKRKESSYLIKFVKRLTAYLRTEEKEVFIMVGILAFLGCMIFSEQVSDFIFNNMVKYHNVIISNSYIREEDGNTLKVFNNEYEEINSPMCVDNIVDEKRYGFYNFSKLKDAVIDSRNILVMDDNESDNGYGYFEFLEEDSYLVLRLPVYPNTCLTLSTDNNIYSTDVSDIMSGFRRVVDYENVTEASIIKVYLYSLPDYLYIFVEYFMIYFFIYVILYFIILMLFKMANYFYFESKFASKYNPVIVFLLTSVLYVTFAATLYYFNFPNWKPSTMADVYYYMNPQILDENGHFSLQVTAEYIVGFRGYFSIVIAIVAKGLELLTGFEMIYFYILYYGILVAFTISIAMPKLYEYFVGKQASNAMCITMFLIFFLFWYPFFFYALVDIPAAMCAISSIAYILSALKKSNYKEMFWGGILFGIALSYRMAYKYIFAVLVVWIAYEIAVKLFTKKINWKKAALILGVLLGGFLLVAFPQAILNYIKGHIGLFPYSEGRGYDVNSNSTYTLTWGSFTKGFHMYNLGQKANTDKQLARIDQFYYMSKLYSAGDLIYMVLSNPIDFCVGYFKHLFWAMSAETEVAYSTKLILVWLKNIASLFNYVLVGEYLLFFINNGKRKMIKIKDEILILLLTFSSICIQNLSHIERRYYLFYYLFIYFIMSFIFQDYIKQKRNEADKANLRHFIIMTCFVLGCYIFKETIRYNFIG